MENSIHMPQVTLKHIDWIIDQGRQSYHDNRWQQQQLKDLQRSVQRRLKELRVFFLTVDALQTQYRRQQHNNDQLVTRLDDELADHDHVMQGHQRHQRRDEQQLGHMEKQLQQLRLYAAQRREKKAMREKQYHDVYQVPVINTQYRKKYMRARDKNNAAEQQLLEFHHAMDLVKDRLKHHQQQWTTGLQHHQSLTEQRQQLTTELEHRQQLMAKMKQAQSFWSQFDRYHVQPCLELLQHLINQDSHDDQWTRLRLLSVDYEETERYGQQHWNHTSWDINFECTHCHTTCESWPSLDKVRTTQLLCTSCYQDTRTSMIIEKKLYSILPGNGDINNATRPSDRLRLSTLSTSSSASIPSLISSTSKSTHSIINDCQPIVKKIKSALTMNQKVDPLPHTSLFVPKYSHSIPLPH